MTTSAPVLFIHGLWLHARSWDPWIDHFPAPGTRRPPPAGPATRTRSRRPGHTRKPSPTTASTTSSRTSRPSSTSWPAKPILVGHSFGGMIAQKLLGADLAAAAVAIDAAQIKGVLPLPLSALKATLPVFKNPANRHRAVSLTADQFRFAFGNAIPAEESDALHERWTIPAPGRPLFEAAAANFDPHSPAKVNTGNGAAGRCC